MPFVLWVLLASTAAGPATDAVTSSPPPATAPVNAVTEATRAPEPFSVAATATSYAAAASATTASTMERAPLTPPQPIVNFRGELLERGTRKPLADAQVVIAELGMMAFSDRQGRFAFEDVPPGTYTVIVPIVGYEKFQTSEEITEEERTSVRYYVEPASSNLEIVVEADRVRKEVTRISLRREEITKVAGTNNDALRVIQTLPGVTAVNELRGDLLVRGSGPFDNLIEIDRMRVPFAYHFGGLKSVYSSEMLSRIDFYPGGFSAKYGDAMGGVVAAETREGNPSRYSGFLDVNVLLAEGLIEGPVTDTVRLAVSGRRSYLDFLAGPLTRAYAPPGQYDFTVFPQFYDYQVRLDYEPTDRHRFSVLTFGADDIARLFADVENDREPGIHGDFYLHNSFHNQGVVWLFRPNAKTRLRTMAAHYTVPQEVRMGETDRARIVTTVPNLMHDGEWEHGTSTLRFGVDAAQTNYTVNARIPRPPQRGETDYSFTDAPRIDANRTTRIREISAYVEEIWQLGHDLKLIPGIRGATLFGLSEPYVDGRFAARYSPVTDTTIKVATGTFHDYPNPIMLDRDFGNPKLLPQRAIHYVAGVEQRFGEGWEASLEAYYKDLDDVVASFAGSSERYNNDAHGYSTGFEIYLRKNFTSRVFGWITYSFSQSRRVVPPESTLYRFRFDQPHVANAVLSYKIDRDWQAGLRWQYSSGNPYTDVDGRIFLVDKGFYVPVFSGELYANRLPPTHRLDFRVDRTFTFDTWKLLIYGEVWNAYLHSNLLGFNYNYDFSKREDIYSFPILPSVGVRGEF